MKRLIKTIIIALGIILGLEYGAYCFTKSSLILMPIDIQDPTVVKLKLDRFNQMPRPRALFIGDSVINGLTLGKHGDSQWASHTIDANFKHYAKGWATLNLGFNGALPCDLCRLYTHFIKSYDYDLIVVDIGIRAFSADFNAPEQMFSRTWLDDYTISEQALQTRRSGNFRQDLEASMHLWSVNHSYLFAQRAYIQWGIFKQPINQMLPVMVDTLKRYASRPKHRSGSLSGQPGKEGDSAVNLTNLFSAKKRYASIDFSNHSSQKHCLIELIRQLNQRKVKAIIFLIKENPNEANYLLDNKILKRHRNTLKTLIEHHKKANVIYIDHIPKLTADRYLDHIHVDAKGNAMIAKAIVRHLEDN